MTALRATTVALALAVAAAFGVFVWATAGFVTDLPTTACEMHEAREGSPWVTAVGARITELRSWTPYRLVERTVVDASVEPGTVVRVTSCGAPSDVDFVVYVAVPKRGGG